MHLQESLQYSPRVLHGQPFAFCPSFLEHTPLHLQLADSTGADKISSASFAKLKTRRESIEWLIQLTVNFTGKLPQLPGSRANFARDNILASDWSINNGIDLSCVIACTCAELWNHPFKDQNCEAYFLQEMYSELSDETIWRSEWGGVIFFSHRSTHSKGVCILMNPSLNCAFNNLQKDQNGRMLSVDLSLSGSKLSLCNIYLMSNTDTERLLVGGDWNITLQLIANCKIISNWARKTVRLLKIMQTWKNWHGKGAGRCFLKPFFSHSRKRFSEFPYKIFVVALHDIIGLKKFSLSFCQT